jgi:hypothetical protein
LTDGRLKIKNVVKKIVVLTIEKWLPVLQKLSSRKEPKRLKRGRLDTFWCIVLCRYRKIIHYRLHMVGLHMTSSIPLAFTSF